MEIEPQQTSDDPKLALELEKLSLERLLLRRQLSPQGILIEWLKAAAVPVTLLGAMLAFFVGFEQLKLAGDNQIAERFDKILTRLASEQADQRITGVSGLRLFLHDQDKKWHTQALNFLINALSIERTVQVQGAILDVLTGIKPGAIEVPSLDEALTTAVERNRSLTALIRGGWRSRIDEDKRRRIGQFSRLGDEVSKIKGAIPQELISRISLEQYLTLLDAEHGPFDSLDEALSTPLNGLVRAITALVAAGARTTDFEGIYCDGCDFSKAANLDGANFRRSFLAGANFSHVSLQKASFRNADLGYAIFFSANLAGADLSSQGSPATLGSRGIRRVLPLLECADLRGADLSGLTIAAIHRDFSTTLAGEEGREIAAARLISAQIDGSTKMDRFAVIVSTSVTDSFLKKHPEHPAAAAVRDRDRLIDDPLQKNVSRAVEFWRLKGDFARESSDYTSTIHFMRSEFSRGSNEQLTPEAGLLKSYLDQPPLRAIPLVASFNAALPAPVIKKRDNHSPTATAIQKFTCSEPGHPNASNLIISDGLWAVRP